MAEPEATTTVYLSNAVRTSAGPGPGVKILPQAEAAALVANRLAVYGDQPPQGYFGCGTSLSSDQERHQRYG
jgi:hypothetical protein